jgi:GntR family transcriptional regulator, transcriptional repressor for pyruvate dehydrogenase complex
VVVGEWGCFPTIPLFKMSSSRGNPLLAVGAAGPAPTNPSPRDEAPWIDHSRSRGYVSHKLTTGLRRCKVSIPEWHVLCTFAYLVNATGCRAGLARHVIRETWLELGEYPKFQSRTAVDGLDVTLRLAIQSGIYPPGRRLPSERELTAAFGVARPTLRLALRRLKAEGYLGTRQGVLAGTYVTDLAAPAQRWLRQMRDNPEELRDIHEYNLMLETTAAASAAERRTQEDLEGMELALDELRVFAELRRLGRKALGTEYAFLLGADTRFHQGVASAGRCRRLADAIFTARGELFTAALLEAYDPRLTDRMHHEHARILDAVRARNSDDARTGMAAHCVSAFKRLTNLLGAVAVPDSDDPGSPAILAATARSDDLALQASSLGRF